jgi:hypothetical protein
MTVGWLVDARGHCSSELLLGESHWADELRLLVRIAERVSIYIRATHRRTDCTCNSNTNYVSNIYN